MKILHLTHTDARVDSRILKELRTLAESADYELHVIGIARHGTDADVMAIHNSRIRTLSLSTNSCRWMFKQVRLILSYLEMLLRVSFNGLRLRPCLVHCHDAPMLPIAVILAWFCRAKLIYDAHELESEKNGQTALLSRITYFVERVAWGRVDGFISVGDSIMRWYESRFGKKESALILNSPVSIDEYDQPTLDHERNLRAIHGIPEGCTVFVSVGLFVQGRGIEKLLRVFSSEDINAHIVFIGEGPLRALIERHALTNPKVHIHGLVPHEQVVNLIKSADFGFCMVENASLSDYYSLPNKLFEYAFAGLPVVASDFPDIRELVDRLSLGICSPDHELEIKRIVLRLQASRPQRNDRDLESISWSVQGERLKGLYSKLLNPITINPTF